MNAKTARKVLGHTSSTGRSAAFHAASGGVRRLLSCCESVRVGRLTARGLAALGGWSAAAISIASLFLIPAVVSAAPEGEQVARGNVTFARNGNETIINASNGSIINYRSFDIGASESVRFIQPDAASRVLNRISSANPTRIDGGLFANGRVYIVNPSGVIFGRNAVVDVAGLYAAAGKLSDRDFLRGRDRFTNLSGPVVNEGQITSNFTALLGKSVLNAGSISAPEGTIVMAAGDSVLIGPREGGLMVRVEGSAIASDAKAAVQNSGTLDTTSTRGGSGRVTLSAGDVWGVALGTTGSSVIKARDVNIQGKGKGIVEIKGRIDASNTTTPVAGANTPMNSGKGGSVRVLGEYVAVEGAIINASGTTGGGRVLVGGNYLGRGPERNATATYVDAQTKITANATEQGDGGRVIVWSDTHTGYYGTIEAKGAGNGVDTVAGSGGFVETSGKETLDIRGGRVDASSAVGTKNGVWLLDPRNVTIQQVNPNGPDNSSGGTFATNAGFNRFTAIGNSAIVDTDAIQTSLDGGTNVEVITGNTGTQDGNITVSDAITMSGVGNATLLLRAAQDILVNANISSSGGQLNVDLRANDGTNGNNDGNSALGNVVFNTTAVVTTNGGTFSSSGVNFTLPDISNNAIVTGAGAITINHTGAVSIQRGLITGAGNINTSGTSLLLDGGGTIVSTGGSISLVHAGGVNIQRAITAGTSLSIQSGSAGGTNNITFGGATPNLAGSTITLRAGNGTGGSQVVFANLNQVRGASAVGNPTNFNIIQDAAMGNGFLPALSIFNGSSVAGMNYGLQTASTLLLDDAALVAGANLRLNATNSVTIDDVTTDPFSVASIDINGTNLLGGAFTGATVTIAEALTSTGAFASNGTTFSNTAAISASGVTLEHSGNIDIDANVTLTGAGGFLANRTAQSAGVFDSSGFAIAANTGAVTVVAPTQAVTLGAVSGGGVVTVGGNTITLAGTVGAVSANLASTTTVDVNAAVTVTGVAGFVSTGTDFTSASAGDIVANNAAGEVDLNHTGVMTIAGDLFGGGIVIVVGGATTLDGTATSNSNSVIINANGSATINGAIAAAGSAAVTANDALAVNANVDAGNTAGNTVSLVASADGGIDNLTFGADTVLLTGNSIFLQAGNGSGSTSIVDFTVLGAGATASLLGGNGGATRPSSFTLVQDANIVIANLPVAAEFGASTGGMIYGIQSSGGSVLLDNAAAFTGTLLVVNGATGVTLNDVGTATFNLGSLAINGTNAITNVAFAGTTVTIADAIIASGAFASNGTTFQNTATISAGGITLEHSGNIDIDANVTSTTNGGFQSNRTAETAGAFNSVGFSIDGGSGLVTVIAPAATVNLGAVTNAGAIIATGSSITQTGNVTTSTTYTANGGPVNIDGSINISGLFTSNGTTFANAGTISAGAVTLEHSGNIDIDANVTLTGVGGFLADRASQTAGNFDSTGFTIAANSQAVTVIAPAATVNLGAITNAGAIIATGSSVTQTGNVTSSTSYTANGGLVAINGTINVSGLFNSNGTTFENSGIISAGTVTLEHSGNIDINANVTAGAGGFASDRTSETAGIFDSTGFTIDSGAGGITIVAPSANILAGVLTTTGAASLSGNDVTQSGAANATAYTLNATGNANLNANITANNTVTPANSIITVNAGTDGTGDVLAGAVTLRGQTINLRAGDGSAGANAAVVSIGTSTLADRLSTTRPDNVTIRQDASIAATDIPLLATFTGGSVTGMNYTLQSDAGSIAIGANAARVAGSRLTLNAQNTAQTVSWTSDLNLESLLVSSTVPNLTNSVTVTNGDIVLNLGNTTMTLGGNATLSAITTGNGTGLIDINSGAATAIALGTNTLTLRGTEIDLDGLSANSITGGAGSILNFETSLATQSINVGSAAGSNAASLDLSAADLLALANSVGRVVIGRTDGAHADLTVGTTTLRSTTRFQTPAGGLINVTGALSNATDNAAFEFVGNTFLSNNGTTLLGSITTRDGLVDFFSPVFLNTTVGNPFVVDTGSALVTSIGSVRLRSTADLAFGSVAGQTLRLRTGSVSIDTANSITGNASILELLPEVANGSIGVGSGVGAADLLVTAGVFTGLADGFGTLNVGTAGGSHAVELGTFAIRDPFAINLGAGGSVVISGTVSGAASTVGGPGSLTITSPATTLGVAAGGAINLLAGSFTLNGLLTVNDAAARFINTISGNIDLNGTVDGNAADTAILSLNSGSGDILLRNIVGGNFRLNSFTIANARDVNPVATIAGTPSDINAINITQTTGTGISRFGILNAGTTGAAATRLAFTGNQFNFLGAIATNGTGTRTGNMVLTNAGTATIGGNVTLNGSFLQNGVGATNLNANIDTVGGNGDITFNAGSAGVTIGSNQTHSAGTGTIAFNDTLALGSNTVTLSADEVDFGGGADSITGTNAILTVLPSTNLISIDVGVTSGGGVLDLSDVDLLAIANGALSQLLIGFATGGTNHAFTIGDSTDGALFRNATFFRSGAGNIIVNGTITGADADSSIFLDSSAAITLNAGIQTAGAAITLDDNVILGAGLSNFANVALLNSANGAAAGANVAINGTVEAASDSIQGLDINAGTSGDITLNGAVGTTNSLLRLAIINADEVNRFADVASPFLIRAVTVQQVAGTGASRFGIIDAGIGGVDLNADAFSLFGDITSVNLIDIDTNNSGVITLDANRILQTTLANSNISIDGVSGGNFNLTLTSLGAVTIRGPVTGVSLLTSSGTTFQNLGAITAGSITLEHSSNIDIDADITLTTGSFLADRLGDGSAGAFDSTGFTIDSGTGVVTVNALANTVTLGDITNAGIITLTGNAITQSGIVATSTSYTAIGGSVAINGNVTVSGAFTSDGTTFANSGIISASAVTLEHSGAIDINNNVTTGSGGFISDRTGDGSAGAFDSTGFTIDSGTSVVTINALANAVTLGGITNAGIITLTGNAITQSGNVATSTSYTANGGTVTINNQLNSGNFTSTGTDFTIGSAGSIIAATAISATHSGDVQLNGDATVTGVNGTLVIVAGNDGTGDVLFGEDVDLAADIIALFAGDGPTGPNTSFIDADGSTLTVRPRFLGANGVGRPIDFRLQQDASIADAGLPDASQFGAAFSGTPAMVYRLITPGTITIDTPSKVAGANLLLTASGGITINGAIAPSAITFDGLATINNNISTNGDSNIVFNNGVFFGQNAILNAGDEFISIFGNFDVGTSSVTLIARDVQIDAGATFSGTNGQLTLSPDTDGINIRIGGTTDTADFDILASELALLTTTGQDKFSLLTIGHSTGTATIFIDGISTFFDPIALTMNGAGGSIQVLNPLIGRENATVSLNSRLATLASRIATDGRAISLVTPDGLTITADDTLIDSTGANTVAAGADITVESTINADDQTQSTNGLRDFAINAGTNGNILVTEAIGTTAALSSVTMNAGSSAGINIDLVDVRTTGAQTYTASRVGINDDLTSLVAGAITINGDLLLQVGTDIDTRITTAGDVNDDVTITGAIDSFAGSSARELVIDINNGDILVGGGIGLNSATPDLISRLEFTGNTIAVKGVRTSGAQNYIGATQILVDGNSDGSTIEYNGPTRLASSVTINGTTSVAFNNTLDSEVSEGNNLTVNSPLTSFANNVGGASGANLELGTITTDAAGTTIIGQAGAINLRTLNAMTFNDAVSIGGDATFTAVNNLADVIFASTLNSTGGNRAVVINSGPNGLTRFGSTVGNTLALSSLTTDSNGSVRFNGNVTTTGAQTYNDAATIEGNTTFTGTNINFNQSLDSFGSPQDLTIAASGNASLNANSGGIVSFRNVLINGATINTRNVRSTNAQIYNGALNLNGILDSTSVGEVRVNGALTLASDSTIRTGSSLSTNAATDDITVIGAITGGGFALDANAGVNGDVLFSGNAAGLSNLSVRGNSITLANTDATGNTNLAGTTIVGGSQLLTGGNLTVRGNAGGSTGANLATLRRTRANGTQSVIANAIQLNGDQGSSTSGTITFTGPVTLISDSLVASGASVTFTDTINTEANNTPRSLTVNTGGNSQTRFGGIIGATRALATLTTNADGSTLLQGASVTTTGDQVYNDAVLVANNMTFAGNDIAFGSTLDSQGSSRSLTINTTDEGSDLGETTFGGNTGTNLAFTTITTNAGGNTRINGIVRATNAITFNDPVLVIGNSTIRSAGSISFFGRNSDGSVINSDTSATDPNLTIISTLAPTTTATPMRFNGSVGTQRRLGNLTLSGERTASPSVATAVFTDAYNAAGEIVAANVTNTDLFRIITGSGGFTMERNEKLTAFGALSIQTTGVATIGDLSAITTINVQGSSIVLRSRSSGPVQEIDRSRQLVSINDSGIDLVANTSITLNAPIITLDPAGGGGFSRPSFATIDGAGITPITTIGGTDANLGFVIGRYDGGVNTNSFREQLNAVNLLPLDLRFGASNTSVATALAGAIPRDQETRQITTPVTVSKALREPLIQMGVTLKDLTVEQIITFLVGRSLYVDLPRRVPRPTGADFQVTPNRLSNAAALRAIEAYRALATTERVAEDGTITYLSRTADVQASLEASWTEYFDSSDAAGETATGAGWRRWLEARGGSATEADSASLEALNLARTYFQRLDELNLSPREVRVPRDRIITEIKPDLDELTEAEFLSAITGAPVAMIAPEAEVVGS